jgi:hypothetical protein
MLEKPRRRREAAKAAFEHGKRAPEKETDKEREAPEHRGFQTQQQLERAFMPFVRFPNWYFCPRCRILKRISWNSSSNSAELKCSNLGRRVEGKGEPCGSLKISRRPTLSPVRFVVACENGHISDFPWSKWAHQNSDIHCDGGEDGSLYLYSTPSAGLTIGSATMTGRLHRGDRKPCRVYARRLDRASARSNPGSGHHRLLVGARAPVAFSGE